MGCAGSKGVDYDAVAQAIVEKELEKIRQRELQEQAISSSPLSANGKAMHNIEPGLGFESLDPSSSVNEQGKTRLTSAPQFAKQPSAANLYRPPPAFPPPSPTSDGNAASAAKKTKAEGKPNHHLRNVFAKPLGQEEVLSFQAPNFEKSQEQMDFLRQAIQKNFVFTNLSERQWKTMLKAFEEIRYSQGAWIIRQGEEGDYFYVSYNGGLRFVIDGESGESIQPGHSFGELALLYDSPRAASVVCDAPTSTLFRLDQTTFRYIMQTQREHAEHDKMQLLRGIPFLKDVDDTDLNRLADAMVPRKFASGEVLVSKGDKADTLFIIEEGKVRVSDYDSGQTKYQDHDLIPGECFGESALLQDERHRATYRGKSKGLAICIGKYRFQEVLGKLSDLIHKSQDKKKLAAIKLIQDSYLTGAALASLASRIVDQTLPPRTVLTNQGAKTPAALYLVRKGRMELSREDGRGHQIVEEGGYFGHETLIVDWNRTVEELTSIEEDPPAVKSKFTISSMDSETVLGVLTLKECRMVIDTTMIGKGKRTDFTSIVDEDIPLKSLKKHGMLGTGTFGQVWLTSKVAPDGTNRPYALKIQSKHELIKSKQAQGVVRERNIMAQLKSPFLIRLVQTYQDPHFIYMLLGLVQGGELYSVIHTKGKSGISEKDAKFYAAAILEGLAYMHRRQIVYRDLKPENVLIAYGGYPVIVDMGFAKIVETQTYTLCGTPLYLAPEVVLSQGHNIAADHWSWGVLIYEMIAGYTPFFTQGIDQITLFRFIVKGEYGFPALTFSDHSKSLIQKILVRNPGKRLGSQAAGISDLFDDPWFSSIDFSALRRKEIEAPWKPTVKDPLDRSSFDNWDHIKPKSRFDYPALSPTQQEIFKEF